MSDRKERQLTFTRQDGTRGAITLHGNADDIAAIKAHLGGEVTLGAPDAGEIKPALPDVLWYWKHASGMTGAAEEFPSMLLPANRPEMDEFFTVAEYRRRATTEEEDLDALAEALISLQRAVAFSSQDFAANHRTAWVYGITNGWTYQDGDCSAMAEVSKTHGWDAATVQRLQRLHRAVRGHIERYEARKKAATEAAEKASKADNFQGP